MCWNLRLSNQADSDYVNLDKCKWTYVTILEC